MAVVYVTAAAAWIGSLAWEFPDALGVAIKKNRKEKEGKHMSGDEEEDYEEGPSLPGLAKQQEP